MQQIIGGLLKGRRLLPLPKRIVGVRPTSSRVRGAIFDRIQQEVQGARVLDLFAGTGANSIEALSRGAAHATLVEKMPAMQEFLAKQMQQLDLGDRSQLIRGDVRKVIESPHRLSSPYDLVFCDPPYAQPELYAPVLTALSERGGLAEQALVVVERSCKEADTDRVPRGWELERQRRYGDTELLFWRCSRAKTESPGPKGTNC